jgi:hypothetical protein
LEFCDFLPWPDDQEEKAERSRGNCQCNKGVKHFVDLFRKLSTLSTEEKKERIWGWELLPFAPSLMESGIKFKGGTSESILK